MAQTILLVDDEFSFLEVLGLLLMHEGYLVASASDGEEALARLSAQPFDLVITDYWMPRMDGLDLCQRMQENPAWRTIPVLLMTAAYDTSGTAPLVAGVLQKPIQFDVLLAEVKRKLPPPG